MTTETDETEDISTDSEEISTYAGMFAEYERTQEWIGPAELPLVFHVRKLCQQLDNRVGAGAEVKAAQWSSYLQAIERLERRRPKDAGPTGPRGDGLEPAGAQPSIFDTMDD